MLLSWTGCFAEGPFCFTYLTGMRKLACALTYPRPRGKVKHVIVFDELQFKFQCALLVQTKEPEELITQTRLTVSSSLSLH